MPRDIYHRDVQTRAAEKQSREKDAPLYAVRIGSSVAVFGRTPAHVTWPRPFVADGFGFLRTFKGNWRLLSAVEAQSNVIR